MPSLCLPACLPALDAGEPLANPITPLYKDPATIEAELALQSTLERATAMQAVQQRAQAHQAAMGKASDPRDALIEQVSNSVTHSAACHHSTSEAGRSLVSSDELPSHSCALACHAGTS